MLIRGSGTCIGLATPGADAQVQVLSQILDAVLHEDTSWDAALAQSRWRLQGPTLVIEDDVDEQAIGDLRSVEHDVVTVPRGHRSMGAAALAGITPEGCGSLADDRRGNSRACLGGGPTRT